MPRGSLRLIATDGRPRARMSLSGRRHLHGVAAGPIDADDVGAEIGQQHAGERAGSDADELDDAYALEGAGGSGEVTDRL